MDKSWLNLSRVDPRYFEGIEAFIKFVRENTNSPKHPCPCRVCMGSGPWMGLDAMRTHLLRNGMMATYTVWTMHGENVVDGHWDGYYGMNGVQMAYGSSNTTMEMLNDVFSLRDFSHPVANDEMMDDSVEHEKYCSLLAEAKKPIFEGSPITVLDVILDGMKVKIESGWSDKSYDKHLGLCKKVLPSKNNNYPGSYREVKKILKNLGLSYKVYHACEHGCVLYYEEYANLESCPICEEPRYDYTDGKHRVPKKVVRYFPLTPRLQRLYTSPHIAKEMRWHGERRVGDGEGDLRHPADGDAWNNFNKEFPEFANEIRNVRLGIATDGFNPFGIASTSHSTWPIVMMPYNLPPSMCMKKEFNILVMLVSGPKSPGKCLNNLMRPLIDELHMLWSRGAVTYDCHSRSSFTMRAAVLWTISDFPGLGMLSGIQTKGYKACPICLDDIDSVHSEKRMSYQGHRRWLPRDHGWRRAVDKFGGRVELRDRPPSLSGVEILEEIESHTREFQVLSLHPQFKKGNSEKLCWTHKSIFYELPYWKYLAQPYSLDVMHIEKNVFECLVGAILSFEKKRHLWETQSSRRPAYTVSPKDKVKILRMLHDAKYPSGYAGSLKNKIRVEEKKFVGLKTHDCHVMLERLIPIFIRPYLPSFVVNPILCLSRWFQRLCCRELTRGDVIQMKEDIVMILCHFERVFPRGFFTIMVHLMIHLPDQVLLKGPVHYNWMYPIERQLGQYKKYVRNTRYPEGCIAEQYIVQECMTYVNLYVECNATEESHTEETSDIILSGYLPNRSLDMEELRLAHWCVLQNCEKAKDFLDYHRKTFEEQLVHKDDKYRIKHSIRYFNHWMTSLRGSDDFDEYLYSLSCKPCGHSFFSQCLVNGVKFVTWERDCRATAATQNSGVMVQTDDDKYYGVIDQIIELKFPHGVVIVVFKCRWFNENKTNIKRDHGLESVDTSQSWYEDTPYCLASLAKQVFYIDDPKCGDNWKVVNVVSHRGMFTSNSLARNGDDLAYQEDAPINIPQVPIHALHIDLGSLPRLPPTDLYMENEDEDSEEEYEDFDEDEDDEDEDEDDDHEVDEDEDEDEDE